MLNLQKSQLLNLANYRMISTTKIITSEEGRKTRLGAQSSL
jgi:hypothetical protein